MLYYDIYMRRQLCREHVEELAREVRRARGPTPSDSHASGERRKAARGLLSLYGALRRRAPGRAQAHRV